MHDEEPHVLPRAARPRWVSATKLKLGHVMAIGVGMEDARNSLAGIPITPCLSNSMIFNSIQLSSLPHSCTAGEGMSAAPAPDA